MVFDLAALNRDFQRIGAGRDRDRDRDRNGLPFYRSVSFGHSGRSSVTAVDYTEGCGSCSLYRRVSRHFGEDIDRRWADILLIICSLISGMLDSAAFNAWGSFANMQTGMSLSLLLVSTAAGSGKAELCAQETVSFWLSALQDIPPTSRTAGLKLSSPSRPISSVSSSS